MGGNKVETIRHIALGCCVLSAVAGMIRVFWPENSFAPVINAVLALYIVSAGLQMVRGTDWQRVVTQLYSLEDTVQPDSSSYSDYARQIGVTASVEAVQEVLEHAGIEATVWWDGTVCQIHLLHETDRAQAQSILAASGGELPYTILSGGDLR